MCESALSEDDARAYCPEMADERANVHRVGNAAGFENRLCDMKSSLLRQK